MNYLPSKLLKLRKHYNYSQAKIAETIGIDVNEYMAIENGRKVLNYNQCKRVANLYHVSVIDIFKNSDEVVLYDVSKARTDELNIEYFLPEKSFGDKLKEFVKKNAVLLGVALGVAVVGVIAIMVFGGKEEVPYVAKLEDVNRLSVSNTTVVYISKEGGVKGSGDNSNGQLSNLPSSGVIKVVEGSNFTIVLNNDGTVSCFGLNSEYEEELKAWTNIVDVAAGDSHVVGVDNRGQVYAVGDNKYGQCEVDEFKDITKVFASCNGTILLNDNRVYYVGDFVGSSQLKNYTNIKDIDTSNDNLVLLLSDGKVEYITTNKNFLNTYKWNDVVDVACGDDFIGALTKDGKVLIDCEDESMTNEVETWTNIIAIDAADDYLIGFDGYEIYGVGKNTYHQFKKEEIEKTTLPQVSGVKISVGNTIDVSFDKVDNALKYEVKLDLGEDSIEYTVSSNQTVSFSTEKLENDLTYTIVIITLGDGELYLNSEPLEANFTFTKDNSDTNDYVEINEDFIGMKVTDFLAYIKDLGIKETNIIEVETGNECEGDSQKIVSVDGISKGQRISRKDLADAKVTYSYCRIKQETSEETQDE